MAIPWRRIRALKWTPRFHADALQFLTTRQLPESKSAPAQARFRRHMRWFCLKEARPKQKHDTLVSAAIVLIEERSGDSKKQRTYQVVPESEVEQVMQSSWSDVKTNGFRGVNSFYERLSRETIGI
jgi:hypothetical protein